MTPFKVVYGRDPPQLTKYTPNASDPPAVQDDLTKRQEMISKLIQNLLRSQHHMKKYADVKRKHMDFQIGDMMLVKLQPYRQNSVALRKNKKLSMKYFGPFPIIEQIGFVAYKLLLPPTAKIHPVFHCSQLKPCRGDHTQQYIPAITIDFETPPVIQPAALLQDRQIMQGNKIVNQFLIQWEGLEESAPTWEDESALRNAYPTFNLEDKVNFKGGGIVTMVEEKRGSRRVRKKNIRLNDYDWTGVH
ncbi:hypothetical protein V8G54_021215 [Vigna mungo]|uniref:Chromo domain-containing protein n=1 Tax=Vigna mungo TaxID=3915 RepID=A0AAQ3RU23_VIGMU